MQAYLQYRRIGSAVRRQLDEHPEWHALKNKTESPLDSGSPNHDPGLDPEQQLPPGIARTSLPNPDGSTRPVLLVSWDDDSDPLAPQNWRLTPRLIATLLVSALGFGVGAASSIESGVLPQISSTFGVSDVVASLATGMYLLGFATGSLVSGPLSEILGRNAVYAGSLTLFMIFVMASGLAPNIGALLAFRFLAGIFGCPPLTCAGGTVADLWSPLEKTLTFPLYAVLSFGGPVLGPLIASYMGQKTLSWRWTNWIILIMSGLILVLVVLFQPETYGPLLLKWKARQLRKITGDERFQSPMDLQPVSLGARIGGAVWGQFARTVSEPIILLISLYMTIIYIVLFTFFDGYPYIFEDVHGLSQGLTNIVWVAMYVGICLVGLCGPGIYIRTRARFLAGNGNGDEKQPGHAQHQPENRLWFAMLGAPFIPIGLFWMGWTDYSFISIWSPIVASAVFGFGTICVFISSYMYVIDSYDIYAASALGFMTVSRYYAAGGMTVVGVPFYANLGVQYTLTILACIAAVMTPVPYVFWWFGPTIRGWSRYAV